MIPISTGNKLLGKGFNKYLLCHGSDNIKRHYLNYNRHHGTLHDEGDGSAAGA